MKNILLFASTFLPSSLRLVLWRTMGFRVGKSCYVAPLSIVIADQISIEEGAVIEPLTLIYKPKSLVLGKRCRIASFVRIIGYGEAHFKAQSFVALGCLIDTTCGFFLGQRSQIGPRGIYYSHGATGITFSQKYPERFGAVTIEDDVWIGMSVVIYPSVTIGCESIVFAGLSVMQDVPPKTAMMPSPNVTRNVPVVALKVGVTKEHLKHRLKQELVKFAEATGQAVHSLPEGDVQLHIPSRGDIILTDDPSRYSITTSTVFWSLEKSTEYSAHTPLFDFGSLFIYGPQNKFSDWVANMLCRCQSIHFVYSKSV